MGRGQQKALAGQSQKSKAYWADMATTLEILQS
jgi:hypothetical protein